MFVLLSMTILIIKFVLILIPVSMVKKEMKSLGHMLLKEYIFIRLYQKQSINFTHKSKVEGDSAFKKTVVKEMPEKVDLKIQILKIFLLNDIILPKATRGPQ